MLLRLGVSAILSALLIAPAAFAQEALQKEIYPILRSYERCAVGYLEGVSAQHPDSSFDEHEASIRPACGRYIDAAKARMFGIGYSPDQVNVEIRGYYDVLRPKLMALFYDRARVARNDQPTPRRDGVGERVREVVMKALDAEYRSCVSNAIRTIVPYSSDSAEALVETAMAKCMDYERRKAEFVQVLFDVPREQAIREVEVALQSERRRILAAIVMVRAERNRAMMEGSSSAAPGATGSITTPAKDF